MRERRDRARLEPEPLVEHARAESGLAAEQGLDRDLATERLVDGRVDFAHRAGTELARHTIATEAVRFRHSRNVTGSPSEGDHRSAGELFRESAISEA